MQRKPSVKVIGILLVLKIGASAYPALPVHIATPSKSNECVPGMFLASSAPGKPESAACYANIPRFLATKVVPPALFPRMRAYAIMEVSRRLLWHPCGKI